jgi:hypothetical protein
MLGVISGVQNSVGLGRVQWHTCCGPFQVKLSAVSCTTTPASVQCFWQWRTRQQRSRHHRPGIFREFVVGKSIVSWIYRMTTWILKGKITWRDRQPDLLKGKNSLRSYYVVWRNFGEAAQSSHPTLTLRPGWWWVQVTVEAMPLVCACFCLATSCHPGKVSLGFVSDSLPCGCSHRTAFLGPVFHRNSVTILALNYLGVKSSGLHWRISAKIN